MPKVTLGTSGLEADPLSWLLEKEKAEKALLKDMPEVPDTELTAES